MKNDGFALERSLRSASLSLPDVHIDILTTLGDGNRSLGLRKLLSNAHVRGSMVSLRESLALTRAEIEGLQATAAARLEDLRGRNPGMTPSAFKTLIRREMKQRELELRGGCPDGATRLLTYNIEVGQVLTLEELGWGNVSLGLRRLLEHDATAPIVKSWLEMKAIGY